MSAPTLPPALAARYEVLELLGRGGMGAVLAARDRELDREVAIKLLHEGPAAKPEGRERFLREARALAALRHPHLLEVYESGVEAEVAYLVAARVDGPDFSRLPAGIDPGPGWCQVGEALAALHETGLLHRDVKPENALLAPDRGAVLIDLGLALDADEDRLTRTGGVVGTTPYLAPELLARGEYSPASDWWAWAVSLFLLREGRLPFHGPALLIAAESGRALALEFEVLIEGDPERVAIEAILVADPAARPATWPEIQRHLRGSRATRRPPSSAANPEPLPASPPARDATATRRRSSLRPLRIGLVLAGGLVAGGVFLSRPPEAAPVAPPPVPAWGDLLEGPEITAFRKATVPFEMAGIPDGSARERHLRVVEIFSDPLVASRYARLRSAAADLGRRLRELGAGGTPLPPAVLDLLNDEVFPLLDATNVLYIEAFFLQSEEGDLARDLSPEARVELRERLATMAERIRETEERLDALPPWPPPPPGPLGEILVILEARADAKETVGGGKRLLPRVLPVLRAPGLAVHPAWRATVAYKSMWRLLLVPGRDCARAAEVHATLTPAEVAAFLEARAWSIPRDITQLNAFAHLAGSCEGRSQAAGRDALDALATRILDSGDPVRIQAAARWTRKIQFSFLVTGASDGIGLEALDRIQRGAPDPQ